MVLGAFLGFCRETQLYRMVLGVIVYALSVPNRGILTVFSNFYSLFSLKVSVSVFGKLSVTPENCYFEVKFPKFTKF